MALGGFLLDEVVDDRSEKPALLVQSAVDGRRLGRAAGLNAIPFGRWRDGLAAGFDREAAAGLGKVLVLTGRLGFGGAAEGGARP
jgi:hypothetical protein